MATTADTASTRSIHSAARCQSGAGASVSFGGRAGGTVVILAPALLAGHGQGALGCRHVWMKASAIDEHVPRL